MLRNFGFGSRWRHAASASPFCAEQMPLVRPGRKTDGEFSGVQQFLEVDAGFIPHSIEEGDQVFRGHIAASARAIGTPAQPGGGGIELANPFLETCEGVGKRTPVRVVKMQNEFARRKMQFFL